MDSAVLTAAKRPPAPPINIVRLARIAVLCALLPLLTACGAVPAVESEPTPNGSPASPTAASDQPPAANGQAPATARPEGMTVGDLAARLDAGWSGVRAFRAAASSDQLVPTIGLATPVVSSPGASSPASGSAVASPSASPAAVASTLVVQREVVLPDRQRQSVRGSGGLDHEAVAVDGRLFVRGPIAALYRPGTPDDTWVELDQSDLQPDRPGAAELGALLAPVQSPGASIPANLRDQVVRELPPIEVEGRSCQAYVIAETSPGGERLDVTLAIDAVDRLCLRETRLGTALLQRVTYAYDGVGAIELPLLGTPSASPAASPTGGATPDAAAG